MSISTRRVRAIFRKELREYRRNGSIVVTMAIFPLIFLIQPLIEIFALPASASGALGTSICCCTCWASRRSCRPWSPPTRSSASASRAPSSRCSRRRSVARSSCWARPLAALVPSLAIAYAVYAVFLACVELFAHPAVASALLRGPDLLAQLLFTPLLAAWSIWVGIAISARSSDVRVAQQLGMLASLPSVAVTSLIAFNVIHATLGLALGLAAVLLVLDGLGWRIVSAMFDRERLGDLAGGVLAIFGIVILAVALVEIATGLFAWRGTGFARVVGILYGLVFGLGALLPVIGSSPTTANTDTGGGVAVLLVFAVGYLYTALVFIVRYRSRPA